MTANNTSSKSVAGASNLNEVLAKDGLKASDIIDQVEYNSNMEYHEFEDEEAGSHTYEGDDADEGLFFSIHTNYENLIDEMDDYERESFQDWGDGHFMDGDIYNGFSQMAISQQNDVRTFDKYLDQSYTDTGFVVSRRATPQLLGFGEYDNPSLAQLKKMRGKIVLNKGMLSTAAAKSGLTIGSMEGEKPIEYKIHIPAGAKGAGMYIGDYDINGWGGKQREFMGNRDTLYVIGKTTTEKRPTYGFFGGVRGDETVKVVHLYYIGRVPHDYS